MPERRLQKPGQGDTGNKSLVYSDFWNSLDLKWLPLGFNARSVLLSENPLCFGSSAIWLWSWMLQQLRRLVQGRFPVLMMGVHSSIPEFVAERMPSVIIVEIADAASPLMSDVWSLGKNTITRFWTFSFARSDRKPMLQVEFLLQELFRRTWPSSSFSITLTAKLRICKLRFCYWQWGGRWRLIPAKSHWVLILIRYPSPVWSDLSTAHPSLVRDAFSRQKNLIS